MSAFFRSFSDSSPSPGAIAMPDAGADDDGMAVKQIGIADHR